MSESDDAPPRHFGDSRLRTMEAYAALEARARELLPRLERAIGDRFEIRYRPWVVLPD